MKRILILLVLVAAFASHAQESVAQKYFSNLPLTDQDGNRVVLGDLMKGRTVVVYSFYSQCPASCPMMAHSLAELQPRFADRLGRDLWFISITVDPENDTPAKLKAYAARNLAKKGWSFLTGSRGEVDAALKKLAQWRPMRDEHTNIWIIGNDATGLWMKANGLAKANELGDIIQKVADDKK
jgi:protein SCO1/2